MSVRGLDADANLIVNCIDRLNFAPGAQMWKLVIMDFLALFFKSMIFDSIRRKAVEKEIVGKMFIPEFYIPGHVLDLMYGQVYTILS